MLAEACLKATTPERFAPIVATALGRGSLTSKVSHLLRSTAWLPLVDGSVIRPEQMVDLGCANEMIAELFGSDSEKADPTGIVYTPEQILPELLETPGFKGIYCNNICHKDRAALKYLFGLSASREDLRMGLAQHHLPEDVCAFLHRLKDIDGLPAAQLIRRLLAVKETPEWQQTVLSEEAGQENPIFRLFSDSQRTVVAAKAVTGMCQQRCTRRL